jgi:hypothetical protein
MVRPAPPSSVLFALTAGREKADVREPNNDP